MKRFTLVLTFAALLAATAAQANTWQRVYSGDDGTIGRCVQETSDSGYVITGTWSLLKTNRYGDSLWLRDYGSGYWVEQTNHGDYIISWFPDLLKTDENGDSLWARDYGIESYCAREISDGGYIITGAQGWTPLVLIKVDSSGDSLWKKTYEEPEHNINVGYFVEETSDSGYIITGATGIEQGEDFATHYLWLIKTDAEGNVQWSKMYGTGEFLEFNRGNCVRQTSDGGYVIVGQKAFADHGFWLLKTDENGDTIWTRSYGGDYGNCVIETADGNYVAVGDVLPQNTWLSFYDDSDVFLIKVGPSGNTIWERYHGGERSDRGNSLSETQDGGYIITGATLSFTPGNSSQLYLIKTDSLGNLDAIIEGPMIEVKHWEIVSSIGPRTILRYWDFRESFKASVFDVAGRKIDEISSNSTAGTLVWGECFPAGVYFIQVVENQKASTQKVVLVR